MIWEKLPTYENYMDDQGKELMEELKKLKRLNTLLMEEREELLNENLAMHERILNQCELLEKMHKGNERLVKEREQLYEDNFNIGKEIERIEQINRDLTAKIEKEELFLS
jgi:anion-transporting  ArsA/GET3 family ATPase